MERAKENINFAGCSWLVSCAKNAILLALSPLLPSLHFNWNIQAGMYTSLSEAMIPAQMQVPEQ